MNRLSFLDASLAAFGRTQSLISDRFELWPVATGNYRPKAIDRSEALLAYLWDLQNPPVGIDVTVSGGTTFNLKEIVTKNVGNIIADKTAVPD